MPVLIISRSRRYNSLVFIYFLKLIIFLQNIIISTMTSSLVRNYKIVFLLVEGEESIYFTKQDTWCVNAWFKNDLSMLIALRKFWFPLPTLACILHFRTYDLAYPLPCTDLDTQRANQVKYSQELLPYPSDTLCCFWATAQGRHAFLRL